MQWLMLNWTLALYYLAQTAAIATAIGFLGYWLLTSPDDKKLPILGGVVGIIAVVAMFAFFSAWINIGLIIVILAIIGHQWSPIPIIPYLFAQGNFFWTIVREGQAKVVLRMGRYEKTLLAKEGHKIDGKNNIVPLDPGDEESKTGLRWVGFWPFWTVYTTTMKYVKALSQPQDGKLYVERNWPGIDFMLAKVAYQYALLFNSCEDKDKLPLSGQITMTARIVNPEKALFRVGNWYDALVSRILPRVRDYISAHTYGQIIGERQLDQEVLKSLRDDPVEGGRTIDEVLQQEYGIELLALEMVNIDPSRVDPADFIRSATLKKWTAKQNAAAEAEETGGALRLMTKSRLAALQERLSLDDAEFKDYLQKNPQVIGWIERENLDLLRRDRAAAATGTGLTDIRVGSTDGSPLKDAGIASFLSGIGAAASKFARGAGTGDNPKSAKKDSSKKGGEESKDEWDSIVGDLAQQAETDEKGKK